jgi:hypothetical protein
LFAASPDRRYFLGIFCYHYPFFDIFVNQS